MHALSNYGLLVDCKIKIESDSSGENERVPNMEKSHRLTDIEKKECATG